MKKTLGVFGAGQLARMIALAARPLGIDVICVGDRSTDCAAGVASVVPVDLASEQSVGNFLGEVDCVTFETENFNVTPLLHKQNIYPRGDILSIAQDRFQEKQYFTDHQIQTAPYKAVDAWEDLQSAVEEIGTPSILKTRRGGYDGKGQFILNTPHDITSAWQSLEGHSGILEGFVDFAYEVSLVGVRGVKGEKCFYPLTQNKHIKGVLHTSTVPSQADNLQGLAEKYMSTLMDHMEYVGVLTIEFFVMTNETGGAETLIANEMAPRVHNSGHWTLDGAATSQFENHVRAVMGLPLGSVTYENSIMVNCLGFMPNMTDVLRLGGVKYHDYEKSPRKNRKVGHINIVGAENIADSLDDVLKSVTKK